MSTSLADLKDPLLAVREFITVTTSMATEQDLTRLLSMIVSSACRLTGCDGGRVYILDQTKRNLLLEVFQVNRAELPIEGAPSISLTADGKANTTSVCGFCTFSGELANVPDVYRHSAFDCSDVLALDDMFGFRSQSLLAVPMRNNEGNTVGVLQLLNFRHHTTGVIEAFPKTQEKLVVAFASQAAVAVDNVQLIAENRRLIDIMSQTNRDLERENLKLRARRQRPRETRFTEIIGSSPAMTRVFNLMEKVLDSDATVLLRGETGTGKELIATALHENGRRGGEPFVAQNCAALPEGLLESELFGYVKGAFSGATTDKKGLIESADGGTLFLDEIGDMPIGLQAKLLRVLQQGEVRPLGALESRAVDVRLIAATHCDLENKISSGDFREDLYYRLSVFPIELPPLRERREDIPALLDYYLKRHSDVNQKKHGGFSPVAMDALLRYEYPGNIRELRNIVERAVLLCDRGGSVLPEHLPTKINRRLEPLMGASSARNTAENLKALVGRFEASVIEEKLKVHAGNQSAAARALHVSRRALIDKMNKYGLRDM